MLKGEEIKRTKKVYIYTYEQPKEVERAGKQVEIMGCSLSFCFVRVVIFVTGIGYIGRISTGSIRVQFVVGGVDLLSTTGLVDNCAC
jgi:hypothetical protein